MVSTLSFVIPVKDEEESLETLANGIIGVVTEDCAGQVPEIVFVDDGSVDGSWEVMVGLCERYPDFIKAIRFRRNLGKALALEAGFRETTGELVVTMDADLQDDPREIPRFLERMQEGYDLVSGWKEKRHDPLSKTLPSKIFNRITAWVTGIQLNDFNCGFKCYRREVVENIRLYGELHRYVPVLAADLGFRIGQLSVEHHPRLHGHSKYGWERFARGFVDLLTVMATTRWLAKPGHLFGGIGLLLGALGGGVLLYLAALWFLGMGPIGNRPLLLFGVLLSLASLQIISMGVIAEFFVKNSPVTTDRFIQEKCNDQARNTAGGE